MLILSPDVYRPDTFERFLDLTRFPNIQEVAFGFRADRKGGRPPWIPAALSTLGSATSPRLSVIKLNFTSSTGVLAETMITNLGNNLRWIADEVARIEREFEGAVNFTVLTDSRFEAVLDALNVRF